MVFKPSQKKVDQPIFSISHCMNDIPIWMAENNLKLNDSKTEVMIIGNNHQVTKVSFPPVTIGCTTINPSERSSVRNIGVWMDQNLSMSCHIQKVCQSALIHLRSISAIRKYLTHDATVQLVHAFVTSRLDYGNALLVGLPTCLLDKLHHIQNIAARIVTKTRKYEHIKPVMKDLHWLLIRERIEFKLMLLTYKALNGLAPSYLCNLLEPYIPARPLRSQSKAQLVIPRTKLKTFGSRAFMAAASSMWNSLPCSIKIAPTLSAFKSKLKAHLFHKSYSNIQ